MIISTNIEKVFDKFHHPYLSNHGETRNGQIITKITLDKVIANVTLKVKEM